MPDNRNREDTKSMWALVAVAVAGVVCCAGPVLFVALGLGAGGSALGAALGEPFALVPAVAVLVVAIALVVVRRHL